ncbi:MurR/RpiR family transcriptional regulator [Priestia megaterium]|uniref:MurR/RpiR family transcriptional regulator n=1 Tax=Priestia megaterium TaxID=1404 RepID=UPI001C21F235|nr:MurR/RpiR family transcriptional regulator [Priestia megaterium]MBU8589253.1 MurR/RpiR family transcriptional regulator [Priestia megaterium]NGY80620.1 MurR/RpiR family transcriptional regulator [Priestia megaterium]
MFTAEIIASLNELETSLYNYICENEEKVAYMRIRELADETHVSTSTILRFCRKLNCEGFSEFKTKIKLHLEEIKKTTIKSVEHSVLEFFERISQGNINENIKKAANLVEESNNVLFIGTGSSGIMAEYGARYFSSVGKFSMYINDPYFPIHAKLLSNSVAVALSVSGETPVIITHINQLKEQGIKVISITNSKYSTISKISNINIPYYVTEERFETSLGRNTHYETEEQFKYSDITTQVPVVYILESIAREIYKLKG